MKATRYMKPALPYKMLFKSRNRNRGNRTFALNIKINCTHKLITFLSRKDIIKVMRLNSSKV